jgi:geranylgeranyl reductase family protein
MAEEFDVIIVGGGPGGSACAAYLGREGHKVLLLDKAKFPRDKVCGDAVSGKSFSVLKELNLLSKIEERPHAKVYGVVFSSPNGKVVQIDFPQADPNNRRPGYCMRRINTDAMLFENAKKYAQVKEEFLVNDVVFESGSAVGVKGTDLKTKQQAEFRAKVVVGADGVDSMVAKKMGVHSLPPDHTCVAVRAYYSGIEGLTQNIEIHFLPEFIPGYFWIFPVENGIANVGVGMVMSDVQKQKKNLTKTMFDAIESSPMLKERFRNAKRLDEAKGWTLPFGSHRRKAYGNGCVLLGDAAMLVDPFSGEGVGNATTSARIASRVIRKALAANDFSEKVLKEYDDLLWAELGDELKTSYQMQKWGRHTWIVNFLVGKAAKSKEVRDLISGTLGSEEAKKGLVSPLFYLKLLFA